jgi:AbrB family looped-hinge helix DNA binding protein
MEMIKVSSKGQLVIPAAIRKKFDVRPGMYFEVKVQDRHIVLTPAKQGPLERLYGRFEGEDALADLEREHAEEIAGTAGS